MHRLDTVYFTRKVSKMRHLLMFISAAATLAAANPSFHSPQSYFTAGDPLFLLSGDLNGDGKPDLIAVNIDNSVQTFLSNGEGSFTLYQTQSLTPSPGAVAVGDFNGDGKLDVAIAGNSFSQNVIFLCFSATERVASVRSPKLH
jgi:hypothetical protein